MIRLDDGQLPARWWESRIPRVSLRLREVAEVLAPQALIGVSALPPIEREADLASCKPWRRTGYQGINPGSSMPRDGCAATMTSERDAGRGLNCSVRYGGDMSCCAVMGSPTAA